MVRVELRNKIAEENKYYDLLQDSPLLRLQGYSMDKKKVVVGIVQGEPAVYKPEVNHLIFKYFDTWKEAYTELI